MREDLLVGRTAPDGGGREQRGLEPAPVLITALQQCNIVFTIGTRAREL